MKSSDVLMLSKRNKECPKCGNEYIGNGQGKLIIDDESYFRSCKCGWNVTITIKEDEK